MASVSSTCSLLCTPRRVASTMRATRATPACAAVDVRPRATVDRRGDADRADRVPAARPRSLSVAHDRTPSTRRVVAYAVVSSVHDDCEENEEGACLPIENAPSIWKVRGPVSPCAHSLPPPRLRRHAPSLSTPVATQERARMCVPIREKRTRPPAVTYAANGRRWRLTHVSLVYDRQLAYQAPRRRCAWYR
jgi:hypothetical protein